MASTPVGSHGSESPPSSAPSGKRKRHPSPCIQGQRGNFVKEGVHVNGWPSEGPSPAAAGKMNTPVIVQGLSSAKEVWVTSKAVQELSTNAFQYFVQLHSSHM